MTTKATLAAPGRNRASLKFRAKLPTHYRPLLYNARPQWLADAHRDLDEAVAAAYGWPADISEDEALAKLLELNLSRAGASAVQYTGLESGD